jgi:hypothetical protein
MKVLGKYIHGSEDSVDVDTYYWVDELPSTIQECKTWCESREGENANLFTIHTEIINEQYYSVVDKVYKGVPDEVNNSLLRTYDLHHHQESSLPPGLYYVQRDSFIKYIRAVRGILSHLSRSQYRTVIKSALSSGDWKFKLNTLLSIPLADIDFSTLNHHMSPEDIKKVIAFQIGQSIGLMDGYEYYTKSEIAYAYPILRQFLYRNPDSNINELTAMLKYFIKRIYDEVNTDIIYEDEEYITFIYGKYDVKNEKRIW